ncbi:MAG: DinB family protein [Streptosporangiaceae bacterium]
MTSSGPVPPLAPDELVSTGGERQVLEAFLDLYRDILRRKLAGLSDQEIRQRCVPSQTTLGGLVKHLSAVEREWFQVVLAGCPDDPPGVLPPTDHWTLSSDDTVGSLLARYEQACAASRRIASAFSLGDCVPHPRLGQVSLRWIYVHMIEESARHVGHADILREQTDGATGFDG